MIGADASDIYFCDYELEMNDFYDWIMDMDSNTNVLTIGCDSEDWGPGKLHFHYI